LFVGELTRPGTPLDKDKKHELIPKPLDVPWDTGERGGSQSPQGPNLWGGWGFGGGGRRGKKKRKSKARAKLTNVGEKGVKNLEGGTVL